MESITKTRVPDEKRGDYLPRHVGNGFFAFENGVYDWMGQLCAEYSGGYWQFYDLSNCGFFMGLDTDVKQFHVENPANYFEDDMTPEAVSIAACLFSLNGLCWQTRSGQITDAYYALRDFAAAHAEGAKIMRLID